MADRQAAFDKYLALMAQRWAVKRLGPLMRWCIDMQYHAQMAGWSKDEIGSSTIRISPEQATFYDIAFGTQEPRRFAGFQLLVADG